MICARCGGRTVAVLLLWICLAAAPCSLPAAEPSDATTPGELRSYATINSIGVEWDITGDANHNAACTVRYKPQGAGEWKQAMSLFRSDVCYQYGDNKSDRAYNMLAGSVMFLSPGTTYDVRLELSDPDGGREVRDLNVSTRPEHRLPEGGRTLHVAPGSGDGPSRASGSNDDGSEKRPFRGLEAAQAAAGPGDRILLHKGDYGEFAFSRPGAAGKPIVWMAAGDGDAVLRRATVGASHVWLEGLAFERGEASENGLTADGAAEGVVIRRCRFTGYHYSITLKPACRDWYIADNVIVGDKKDASVSEMSGEGVELNHSSGHVVAHNRISRVADGVSYAHRNCDIFGNDIRDVTDDGIEPDYGYSNIRIWGNRIHGAFNHAFSFQPQFAGPWYIVRNEMSSRRQVLKPNMADRFVLVANTLIGFGPYAQGRADLLMKSFSRNNLWILLPQEGGGDKQVGIWSGGARKGGPYEMPPQVQADWRTDVDYDGFDWGDAPAAFVWPVPGGRPSQFRDIASFAAAVGIERHGIRVRRGEVFEVADVRAYTEEPFSARRLTLRAGCNAIDAGQAVPNICDDFVGKAPDLGAHEFGRPPAVYGPRP